jgi:beta-lactam-binding protein with PASTA domain
VRRLFRRRAGAPPPKIWPWLVAVLVFACAGIGAAYALSRDDDDDEGGEAATASVPAVVGRVAEQASGGPATARVPDVMGLPLAQAFTRLEAAGLRPQAKREFSPRPRGRVFRQRPAAGTELEREQTVLLTVSRGPGRVSVPNLIGLREAAAVRALVSAGLEGNVVRVASGGRTGTVVAQNPVAGIRAVRGSTVRVNVSRGAPPTTTTTATTAPTAPTQTGTASSVATVPDVVGLDAATAERRLRQAGFAVSSVPRDTLDPAEDGIVLEQQPTGGASARSGAQVTISVGILTA